MSKEENTIVSAETAEDLKKVLSEMIEQGWEADGSIQSNEDGTFSQKMKKIRGTFLCLKGASAHNVY